MFDEIYESGRQAGIMQERERVLSIARHAIKASGDGRDLVVRTDILGKVEHPNAPCFGKDPAGYEGAHYYNEDDSVSHTDEITIDADAVAAHLARNDVPKAFLRVALKALECVHEKQSDRRLKLPTNVVMPASAIVERLHLGGFLQLDKVDGE